VCPPRPTTSLLMLTLGDMKNRVLPNTNTWFYQPGKNKTEDYIKLARYG